MRYVESLLALLSSGQLQLLFFDPGYFRYQLFDRIHRNGGHFITRLATNADPSIVAIHRQWSARAVELEGKRLNEIAAPRRRENAIFTAPHWRTAAPMKVRQEHAPPTEQSTTPMLGTRTATRFAPASQTRNRTNAKRRVNNKRQCWQGGSVL